MKENNKLSSIFLTLTMALILLSSCGAQKSDSAMPEKYNPNMGESYDEDIGGMEDMDSESMGEKVISTYFATLETLNFESTHKDLNNLIEKHKAFIENSSISNRGFEYSKNYKSGYFSLRIPKEKISVFKEDLKKLGNITNEGSSKEDVTKFYRDTESRLKLLTIKEESLLELLEKATQIEDIIAIESELTDTIFEKERLETDLKSIDNKIEYTTLDLDVFEVRNYSNVDKADSSLSFRLKNAFKDSFFAFKVAVENFMVWLVFAIPYILVLVPVVILGVIFIKKRKDKNIK